MASSVEITEKNPLTYQKNYIDLPEPQRHFQIYVVLDINYFTDEPVVQDDLPVVRICFSRFMYINDINNKS